MLQKYTFFVIPPSQSYVFLSFYIHHMYDINPESVMVSLSGAYQSGYRWLEAIEEFKTENRALWLMNNVKTPIMPIWKPHKKV